MKDDLLALRVRPEGKAAMRQTWHHLTFVHWAVEPDTVQELLPAGLEADLFDGRAYVSLVPFTMTGVTPIALRPRPFFSEFHETNVRTYVRRHGRQPGVWFFSLEASKLLPVVTARSWYRLPYHFARMEVLVEPERCRYATERIWPGPPCASSIVTCSFSGEFRTAEPGTLEFWLLERYLLYAATRSGFSTGRVWHEPYEFADAEVTLNDSLLTEAAGFRGLGAPVPMAQYCKKVEVEVFPLRPCD